MTKLNLINEKDLTKAISSLLYNDTFSYTPENLRDINFVKENKEEIAKALILQSLKKQCREWLASIYEKNPHSLPFEEVTESDIKDIKWAQDAINNGGSVHKYITDKNFPDDVVDNLTKARDFLYQRAIETVDKQIQDAEQRPKNKKNIINLSALLSQYKSLDLILEGADKWHQEIAERAAQEAQKEADLKKALEGTEFLMDLPDGLKAYRLLTPEALDYESSKMGHCVGSGGYDSDVKAGTTKIYSLRDKKGEPHVTFEVRMNNDTEEMHQCKGKENKAPVVKYLQAVQTFIREKKFKIKADLKNTGLLYLDGEYYDLFNLPEGLVIKGDLDVSGYNFEELPACFSKIKVKGSFNCSGCYNLKSLKNAPQSVGGKIITTNTPLIHLNNQYYDINNLPEGLVIKGDLDVSGYNFEELPACFSKIKVKGSFKCSGCYNLKSLKNAPQSVGGDFDCSDCTNLTSSEGAPQSVGGDFDCSDFTNLTSSEGAPQSVGGKIITKHTPIIYLNNQYYNFNDLPEGSVIKGDLDVSGYNFEELPACFSKIKVEGSFKCSGCYNLKSLKNAPQSVGGDFDCSNCRNLTSVEGAPQSVGGKIITKHTPIIYLNNQYYDINNLPEGLVIKGDLDVSGFDFEELPACFSKIKVEGSFKCSECSNLKSLKNAPQSVGGDFNCLFCPNLSSLVGAPQSVGGDFNCLYCSRLSSSEGAPQSVGGKIITKYTPIIYLNNQYYDINNLPEGLVIKGDLDVSGYNFEELPACFSKIKVEGSFKCSGCSNLKSLKNAPQSVGGDFDCSRCSNLSSLKGAPQSVGGDFDCSNCYFLSSLEGAPQYVGGDFDCSDCDNLTSLEGAPQSVGGDFDCSNCYRLSSLKNIPILKGKIKYKNTNITVFSKLFYSIRNKINVLKEKNSKRKTGKIKEVLQKLSSKNETIKKETIHTDMPKETMIQKPVLNTKQNRTATSTKTTTLLSLLHNRRNIR